MAELINWYIGDTNEGNWMVFSDPFSAFAFIFDRKENNFVGMTEDRDFSRFSVEEGRLLDMDTCTAYEVV